MVAHIQVLGGESEVEAILSELFFVLTELKGKTQGLIKAILWGQQCTF